MIISVTKNNDTKTTVGLFPHKDGGRYHFVNLTKGHICMCEFDTVEKGIEDLNNQILNNKIKNYTVVSNVSVIPRCYFCHSEMIWGGDHMKSDLCPGVEPDGIIANFSCPHCSASVVFTQGDEE
ncbi:MAG: hypothetical protein ACRDD8_06125 [Bacteroidales bacterium]